MGTLISENKVPSQKAVSQKQPYYAEKTGTFNKTLSNQKLSESLLSPLIKQGDFSSDITTDYGGLRDKTVSLANGKNVLVESDDKGIRRIVFDASYGNYIALGKLNGKPVIGLRLEYGSETRDFHTGGVWEPERTLKTTTQVGFTQTYEAGPQGFAKTPSGDNKVLGVDTNASAGGAFASLKRYADSVNDRLSNPVKMDGGWNTNYSN